MFRTLAIAIVATGCATTTAAWSAPLENCSLDNETACVAYAEQHGEENWTPFEFLVVGLSDRAAQLEGAAALDFHRRVVELVEVSDTTLREEVARRAAPSHVVLAALLGQNLRDFEWSEERTLEVQMSEIRAEQDNMRRLATFVINHGEPESLAEAGWLLVYGYERHAELLRQIELPEELTVTGRADFRRRLNELVISLEREGQKFRSALRRHCRAESLDIPVCALVSS